MGGVVSMAPGERVGLRAFTASWSFALLSFATASGMAGASDRAAGCSWGAPWGRGARVELWRVLGVGGVVPMAAGGRGSSCLHRIKFFCPVVFCKGINRGQGLRIGLLVALGECHGAEVRVLR